MIASTIKPWQGLSPEDTATLVQTTCEARVDVIKDDEKLMSPAYWPLSSADPHRMMRDHDQVVRRRGNAAVINIDSIGPGAMAFLRRRSALRLHAHRDGGDILTRHPALGMEYRALQKIWRLPGVNQFQTNGIRVKCQEQDDSLLRSLADGMAPIFDAADRPLPVVCSGQWGGQPVETYQRTGRTLDLMYLGGGSIQGHPNGPAAGVGAIRRAWAAALAKWGG